MRGMIVLAGVGYVVQGLKRTGRPYGMWQGSPCSANLRGAVNCSSGSQKAFQRSLTPKGTATSCLAPFTCSGKGSGRAPGLQPKPQGWGPVAGLLCRRAIGGFGGNSLHLACVGIFFPHADRWWFSLAPRCHLWFYFVYLGAVGMKSGYTCFCCCKA